MAKIQYLKDNSNVTVYPVTHERAVKDSEGVTLNTKLTQFDTWLDNLGDIVSGLGTTVNGLSINQLVEAWDGSSTPVQGNIPSGVQVEYNETTYTGSLAASSSTIGKVYLVGNENDDTYERYITSYDGTTYSWVSIGSTEVDMSDYQRKDDEIWLTEAEYAAIPVKDTTKIYNVYEEQY